MLEVLVTAAFWIGLLKIIWVNLLLSGDNAVVIALASRSLPPRQQKLAMIWGSGAAMVMRVVLTAFAVALLRLPFLKLIGGGLLVYIGVQLLVPDDEGGNVGEGGSLSAAIRTILVADLVMSLDNVLAVAAAADAAPEAAKYPLLILGLAISIPIVMVGSNTMLKLMERFPVIITLGAALLGWIAGEMAVSDPWALAWVQENAAWLHDWKIAPLLGAALVVATGAIVSRRAVRHAALNE